MNLVIGATGILGSAICRRLRDAGLSVRALVRAESPRTQALRDAGAELFVGDLRRPADLDAACRGVTAVFSTATAMGTKDKSLTLRAVDGDGQLSLVAAAKRSGVGHFVFISASPNLTEGSPLVRYKRAVERAVRESGMRWTILQPSVFMEVWLGPALGWNGDTGTATIFGRGESPMPWISAEDVAAHAVASLDDVRLHDRNLPLGGPDSLSPNHVLTMFEQESGRKYKVRRVPLALLQILGPVIGVFDELTSSGMRLGAESTRGDLLDETLQRELGLPLRTVAQHVKRMARPAA